MVLRTENILVYCCCVGSNRAAGYIVIGGEVVRRQQRFASTPGSAARTSTSHLEHFSTVASQLDATPTRTMLCTLQLCAQGHGQPSPQGHTLFSGSYHDGRWLAYPASVKPPCPVTPFREIQFLGPFLPISPLFAWSRLSPPPSAKDEGERLGPLC